ncbi:DsbA family oxidoreductase [Heyndrickxia coagulans]|uniref:DsbA family oxidoreductase n=1 Tax=Heyndrickxia coagulans TaxID=1398 RepID=UPI0002F879A2|nr:DsbA family protein [Heyndrickxia coagulans]
MKIELWSDFSSADSYLAFVRIGEALEQFGHRESIQLEFRSFMKNPEKEVHIEGSHKLLHFAKQHGKQSFIAKALFETYARQPSPGKGDLLQAAQMAGLDKGKAEQAIVTDVYLEHIKKDQAEADLLGADFAPFMVINRKYAISGARPVDFIVRSMHEAWREEIYVAAI